jgi:UPF0755 protein
VTQPASRKRRIQGGPKPRGSRASRRPRTEPRAPSPFARVAVGFLVVFVVLVGAYFVPHRIVMRIRALIPGQVERVVVREGADLFQVAELLQKQEICAADAFVGAARSELFRAELGATSESVEGYIAPLTYEFFRQMPAEEVLGVMLTSGKRLRAGLGVDFPEPLQTLHEVITLASLVEREAQLSEERSKIASVFLNRLRDLRGETRGRLQSDPSAVYGCLWSPKGTPGCEGVDPSYGSRKVTPAMLRSDQNPYNTYRHSGLPPGPICTPGRAALLAVLEPSPGDYLYFVADGRGGHHFSRTYDEHRAWVEKQAGRARDQ